MAGPTWMIASRIILVWPDVTRTTNPTNSMFPPHFLKLVLSFCGRREGRRGRVHLAMLEPNDSWAPVGEEVYVMSDAMPSARLGKTKLKILTILIKRGIHVVSSSRLSKCP